MLEGKGLLMVDWFTFSKQSIDTNINLFSYLYSSDLNVPDFSFQHLSV